MPQQSASQMCNKPLDNSSEMMYNNTARVDKGMKYIIYDNQQQQVGEFLSIYDLELFVDGIREGRGRGILLHRECLPLIISNRSDGI